MKSICIEELSDFHGPLADLRDSIENLIEEYGEDCLIWVDAGHNNVEFMLQDKTKRKPKKKKKDWIMGIDPNKCPHKNVQDYTECCLDCGYNIYGHGWDD